jgi:hypothetical protein
MGSLPMQGAGCDPRDCVRLGRRFLQRGQLDDAARGQRPGTREGLALAVCLVRQPLWLPGQDTIVILAFAIMAAELTVLSRTAPIGDITTGTHGRRGFGPSPARAAVGGRKPHMLTTVITPRSR